jgi:hypothetical protein
MTAVVPVLLRTTLSQRAVPASLLCCPVVCRIYGGRTVCSFQGAEGFNNLPLHISTPHASAQTDNYFCKVLKIVEILRFVVNNAAPFFLFRTRDTVSRVSGSCMVSHCLMPNFSMP